MRIIILVSALVSFMASNAQNSKPTTDYLKLGNTIEFEKQVYHLAWTSHPSTDFFKQEYIPGGDAFPNFRKMMLIDFVKGNHNVKEVVGAKMAELNNMKRVNPMVNYEILENATNGEYILDFLLTQNSADGTSIVFAERNVYRYKKFEDKSGNKGILLFGISTRSYGKEIEKFLTELKSNRKDLISSISRFPIPEINPSGGSR